MARCAILALPVVGAAAHTAIASEARAQGPVAALVETSWQDARTLRILTEDALREHGMAVFAKDEVDRPEWLGPRSEREMTSAGVTRLFILRLEHIGERPRVLLDELRLEDRKLLARVTTLPFYLEQMPEVIPVLVTSLLERAAADPAVRVVVSPSEDRPTHVFRSWDRVISFGTFGWGGGVSLGLETRSLRFAGALSTGGNGNGVLVGGVTGFLNGDAATTPFVEGYVGLVAIEGATGWGALVNGGVAMYRDQRWELLLGAGLVASADAHRVYPTARVEISFR